MTLKRLFTLMLAVMGAACLQVDDTPPAPNDLALANTATYAHPSGVFTVELPRDWVVADASDEFSIRIDFSPPGAPEPLFGVYVVERSALADLVDPGGPPEEFTLERFIDYYITTILQSSDVTYKELDRLPQPDSSIRISYVLDSPDRPSAHNAFYQFLDPYFVVTRVRLPTNDPALTRTLTSVINTLRINQQAGWSSIYQGEGEASADAIVFTNLNTFVGRNNTFQIVGQVRNNAASSLEFVEVTAQLYDEDGRVLIEQADFITSDLVTPGEYAPFAMTFTDGAPEGTVRYDLQATGRYAELTTQSFYGSQNFAVSQEAIFDETGLVLRGQVRNEGTATASLVKVIVTIFDSEGRVIGTDTTLVDRQRLAPGETSPYEVSFVELGGQPNSFIVTAQGIRED